jgi:hypothetical protein
VVRELAGAALQANRGESSDKHCAVKRRTVSVMGLIGERERGTLVETIGENSSLSGMGSESYWRRASHQFI